MFEYVKQSRKGKPTDGSFATGGTVHGRNFKETIGINLESGDKLSLASRHRRDTSKLELAEQTVITALSTLTLVPKIQSQDDSKSKRVTTYTGKVTVVWLSSTVVNTRDLFVGMGVLRGTTTPKTSPCMATPSDRGATSRRRRS